MKFQSDRLFQVWDYHISHARMLIRSPISPDNSTNIDIIFHAVDHLNIPTCFRGLDLTNVACSEAVQAGVPPDELDPSSTVFRLETEGRSYYIVAFACRVLENELELLDSSLAEPWEIEPRQDLGRLLARS
jgi:hypothetical protein